MKMFFFQLLEYSEKRKIYCIVKMKMKILAVMLIVLLVAVAVESKYHHHGRHHHHPNMPRRNLDFSIPILD